uniref:Uncharacterized protein n=1 Tax=Aegilops tauschii subsp. strangulata TaxID=200361 RepID=A0A453T5A6_AEGTS
PTPHHTSTVTRASGQAAERAKMAASSSLPVIVPALLFLLAAAFA